MHALSLSHGACPEPVEWVAPLRRERAVPGASKPRSAHSDYQQSTLNHPLSAGLREIVQNRKTGARASNFPRLRDRHPAGEIQPHPPASKRRNSQALRRYTARRHGGPSLTARVS